MYDLDWIAILWAIVAVIAMGLIGAWGFLGGSGTPRSKQGGDEE